MNPFDHLFEGAGDLRPASTSDPHSAFVSDEARALRGALNVFDVWSKRILMVCELHLRAENDEAAADRATPSLSTNHWLLPMLFSELERQATGASRRTLRALQNVKVAKSNVAPFLNPAQRAEQHARAFGDATARLQEACERFHDALTEDVNRRS
ncbi:hypothetical protein [Caballeronia sp. GAFFF2]|uniref:hypothetical protein n=1 Tax=Caballeronia sp. GAFFF2 TaxID=2921741 RepID=UPI002028E315|nr:hypothetical protein [Caballeronia sp. GAFFF2]